MRESKFIGDRPRPWQLVRLQWAIGNRAVHRILSPAPAPKAEDPQEPEPVPKPKPEPPAPGRSILWLLCAGGALVGAAAGYAVEMTPAAPYAGPALGLALGAALCLQAARGRR
jgi:hypothetical protein